MTLEGIAYQVRRMCVLEARAKGPKRRIEERAAALARLNLFLERFAYTPLWADARVLLQSTERMH